MREPTAEERAFRDEVTRFVEAEITPHVREWERDGHYPTELFTRFGSLGWTGIGIPEIRGGSGGGAIERCILFEELARASAGVALGIYVHAVLAGGALAIVASDELRDALLPGVLSGSTIGAWAYAEPNSGADVTRVQLSAKQRDDVFILDGTKLYITNGTIADLILVVARTSGSPGSLEGISVFAVDGDSAGLTRRSMDKLGMHPSELGELHFEEVVVPANRLVGQIDTGFRQCIPVLSQGRIFGATLALGIGRAALDAACTHVQAREQFGGPLTKQQAVRFTLADMTARLAASRTLVYDAADLLEAGKPYDTAASIAKLVASETGTWLAERAMHLHGAQGFMMESPVQRYYRDCKIIEYGEGANEVQREMILDAVIKGWRP
ncbi:MAG: acyl-CoA dehydrogenase family protein [Acidimicrobiia bacterium]|nr:acyl-CoA dehydrogenase family protein [Acidimicrobiia bacterium]